MSDFPCNEWPVDEGCGCDLSTYPTETQQRAVSLATETLHMLTGYRVGGCPVTVRPCSRTCVSTSASWHYSGGTFYPHISVLGQWVNGCCGASSCDHLGAAAIRLPGPVGYIKEVLVDGEVVPAEDYTLHNGNELVRIDGEFWPTTQDMTLSPDQAGTFAVTYLRGIAVDGHGSYAAGILACEFAKACSGEKCRLPDSVTAITRQGVSMERKPGLFPDGKTGIREVDIFIHRWNPNGLKAPTTVWSPDRPHMRVT